MKRNQVLILFLINSSVLFVGMGLFPLLPVYAAGFGADNIIIGIFFATIYVASALGPATAGWLGARMPRKKLLILAALPGVPTLALMGQATALWQVIALATIMWFIGGIVLTLTAILNGLRPDRSDQGKSYSLLSLSGPVGSLAGGAVTGGLLAWQGFPVMFAALAGVWAAIPLIAWFGVREPEQANSVKSANQPQADGTAARQALVPAFFILLAVSFLSSMTINLGRLGTTLSMQELSFSGESVASTATVGGIVAVPVILLAGALADRLGRKHFLAASYLLAMSGALLQGVATELWQFWLATSMFLLAFSLSGAMSSALLTEILPAHILNKAQSSLSTVVGVANVITFAAGGYLITLLGLKAVYLLLGLTALSAAAGLEMFIQRPAAALTAAPCSPAAEPAC